MQREPLFMQDLHKKQSKEYRHTRKLNLHQLIEAINNRAKKSEYLNKPAYQKSAS